jgi:filamentous hemagglutinin
LVGGPTGALTSAGTDRFNRQLGDNEKRAIGKAAGDDKELEKRLTSAACYEVKCWAQYKPGSAEHTANYVSQLEASQLQAEFDWVKDQKQVGLFNYMPLQKVGDAVQSDPVGVVKDVTKVVVGGFTAKTGATICAATGIGCVAGAGMLSFGLSDMVEGGGGLYNRYQGINASGVNPLRWGLTELSPMWGDTAYDALDLGVSALALRAHVPLKMGVTDGLNRPASMFGVSVPRINNTMLNPLTKKPLPADLTQGWLLLGVGAKGAAVVNDVRQSGDGK